MLILECLIKIQRKNTNKKVSFGYVESVEINTSTVNLTDTAKVSVPKKTRWKGKPLSDYIGIGDSISIQLGYVGYAPETVFKGYISSISKDAPLMIECENEMWLLKQAKVKAKRYPHFNLTQFMEEVCPNVKVELPKEISFGEVKLNEDTTAANVLDILMREYPFKAFFRDEKLCGIKIAMATLPSAKTITFSPNQNMISDSLKYVKADDVKIAIVAKSILHDNTILEEKVPEKGDGEVRTFFVPQFKTKAALKKFANEKLKEYTVDKMVGEFEAFGVPFTRKGDIIKLKNEEKPEQHNKRFFAAGVTYTFNQSGYRQRITLGDCLK